MLITELRLMDLVSGKVITSRESKTRQRKLKMLLQCLSLHEADKSSCLWNCCHPKHTTASRVYAVRYLDFCSGIYNLDLFELTYRHKGSRSRKLEICWREGIVSMILLKLGTQIRQQKESKRNGQNLTNCTWLLLCQLKLLKLRRWNQSTIPGS